MIPYSKQKIFNEDLKTVNNVLKSKLLTQGKYFKLFSKKLSKYCNSKFALPVNSATSALHLSYLSLGVKKGDEVWTSAITFVSTANAAKFCGAEVKLIDISLHDFNLCTKSLENKLQNTKKKPKVVTVVHLGGNPCDMKKIFNLSKKYNFKVLEDASHALGSNYRGSKIGSCKFSDMAVFSFHPVKNITTGEGGAILTNNKRLYEKSLMLSSHGMTKSNSLFYPKNMNFLGYNYRMSDINAGLGFSQLNNLEKIIKKRGKLANEYSRMFKNAKIRTQEICSRNKSSYHLYIIYVKNKKRVLKALSNLGYYCTTHYIPIYYHNYYKKLNNFKKLNNSEKYYKHALSIPLFFDLTFLQLNKIIKTVIDCEKN